MARALTLDVLLLGRGGDGVGGLEDGRHGAPLSRCAEVLPEGPLCSLHPPWRVSSAGQRPRAQERGAEWENPRRPRHRRVNLPHMKYQTGKWGEFGNILLLEHNGTSWDQLGHRKRLWLGLRTKY